ncbi:MAG TPA: hypothetical protein VEU09_02935, partial [Candidatus Binatia bacterium]|nr:hypothetical protein [Candidatus Binatia bacterium]
MRSASSSRDISTRNTILLALTLSAALAAAAPSFAQPSLDLRRSDVAMTGVLAFAQRADSAETITPPPPRTESEARRTVNPRKALLLSLLLPGAGETYSGHKGRATGFFVSEGAIWANFAAWEVAGHLRRNNYIEQAQLNAGLGTNSGSDDYWRLVGAYTRSSGSGPDSYEDALRRDARNEFPTDPAAQDAWVAQRLPTGDRAWNWSSAALQESYRATRQNSSRAFSRAKFSFALAILNRIASAIDTQMLHRSDAKDQQSRATDRGELFLLTDMTADGGGR